MILEEAVCWLDWFAEGVEVVQATKRIPASRVTKPVGTDLSRPLWAYKQCGCTLPGEHDKSVLTSCWIQPPIA